MAPLLREGLLNLFITSLKYNMNQKIINDIIEIVNVKHVIFNKHTLTVNKGGEGSSNSFIFIIFFYSKYTQYMQYSILFITHDIKNKTISRKIRKFLNILML